MNEKYDEDMKKYDQIENLKEKQEEEEKDKEKKEVEFQTPEPSLESQNQQSGLKASSQQRGDRNSTPKIGTEPSSQKPRSQEIKSDPKEVVRRVPLPNLHIDTSPNTIHLNQKQQTKPTFIKNKAILDKPNKFIAVEQNRYPIPNNDILLMPDFGHISPISHKQIDTGAGGGGDTDYQAQMEIRRQQIFIQNLRRGERVFYVDWIRAFAVHLVVFIHSLVATFDALKIQDESLSEKKQAIVRSLVQIGIPMFFFLSGMVDTFHKCTFTHYFLSSLVRLLLPLFFAIPVLLVPRLYFGQTYETFALIDGKVEWDFRKYMEGIFHEGIAARLSWLWFLPVLFLCKIINYPFVAWSQRRAERQRWSLSEDGGLVVGQLLLLWLWSLPLGFLAGVEDGMNLLLPSLGVLTGSYFVMYTSQLLIVSTRWGKRLAILSMLIGPIACIGLNFFKRLTNDSDTYGILMMTQYDTVFMAQGSLYQLYSKQIVRNRESISNSAIAPFGLFAFILTYAISSPQSSQNTGFVFFYPLYETNFLQGVYTIGTWLWLYLICWLGEKHLNRKFNDLIYSLIVKPSMWAYISHYLFIMIVLVKIVLFFEISLFPAIILEIFLAELAILISFFTILYIKTKLFKGRVREYDPGVGNQRIQQDRGEAVNESQYDEEENVGEIEVVRRR